MTPRFPWYWSWRGWRASTWIFLIWSTLMWRQIVPLLQDGDEGFVSSRDLAEGLVFFWLVGVCFIVLARAFATLSRVPRLPNPGPRSLAGAVRVAAPFAALALLAVSLAGPVSLTAD